MITSSDCKRARSGLELSREGLAKLSGVSERTIVDFERGAREPINSTRIALKLALESAGAVFSDGMICVPSEKKDSTLAEGDD